MLPEGDDEESTPCGPHASVCIGGSSYGLETVEVKTAVARRTVKPLLSEVSEDPEYQFLTSPEALVLMPKEDIMQVAQQMVITGTNYGLYICTAEVGVKR